MAIILRTYGFSAAACLAADAVAKGTKLQKGKKRRSTTKENDRTLGAIRPGGILSNWF
jgi:hypothetical protein